MSTAASLLLTILCVADVQSPQINPVDRPALTESLTEWTFDDDAQGWVAERQCILASGDGLLKIEATGHDPYMHRAVNLPGGELLVEIRARSWNSGAGAIYWTTDKSPQRGEDKVGHFALKHDGQWHDYSVRFSAPGRLTDLRIDPGSEAGKFEIDRVRLLRRLLHPLTVERIEVDDEQVRFVVKNHDPLPQDFSTNGEGLQIGAEATLNVELPIQGDKPLEVVSVELEVDGFPPVRRTVFVHNANAKADWIARSSGDLRLEVAKDGSMGRVYRAGTLTAILAPLVHCDGRLPALKPVDDGPSLRFSGEGITLSLCIEKNEISVSISASQPCEGPVVRAIGDLEQGLMAGLEYLGKGERSSSKLDVETDEHLRFAPDPMKLTMPLMAFVTDRGSVAMTWSDMQLQPTYATPNFFDSTDDHRMSLRGTKIDAVIQVDQLPLEEVIYRAVKKQGLPPLPEPPRSASEQWDICLKALNGPLRTEKGWGHCVEDRWPRNPHADMASTMWRLSGEAPDLPRLAGGGSHISNESIYFVTGKVAEWKQMHQRQVAGYISRQKPDGSFRYAGKYARGHFEDTASGVCARPAAMLLEYARFTGDEAALEAGLRTLEYMKRFRTPRGAQVWEVALHTPDQLASAYSVWAYVRGYELTGNQEYLQHARKWALSGIPFVYLWSSKPIMLYATPPVFGATNWIAPCWIGLPVQWVGIVYAYGLTMLAPHDDSLDWNQLARGILISGEQQQFPDGEYVGLLPDSIELQNQQRRPWIINPCSLVSLRLAVQGQVDSLCVAADENHRIVAPFPVKLDKGKAQVEARQGVAYQVLIDGRKIVDVLSKGRDVISVE